jgi:hypothetical protein
MRWIRTLVGLAAAAALGGCAQLQLGEPVASIENIQKARGAGIAPMRLGNFALAPGLDQSLDQRVVVRTNTVYSPYESSFANYLKQTLATDLAAAGLLEPASAVMLEALLTDSKLDVPAGPATASVAARFTIRRTGAKVYDKELRATHDWHAGFLGVVAIQDGMNRYAQLYRKLVTQLLDDPEFQAATRR